MSNTLIGNGFGCWKTIVTRRRSAVGSIDGMSTPSRVIRPLSDAERVSSVSRLSERSSVVLPQPEGPIRASTSPWRTGSETSLTAQLAVVGDRELLDLHARDRELRRADPPAPGGREPGGRRAVAVAVAVPCVRSRRSGASRASRRVLEVEAADGRWLQEFHEPAFRERRWTTSTAALRNRTSTSSTNAAAYAFCGLLPSPVGAL